MDASTFDFYQFGGVNQDVQPFLLKDTDLRLNLNMYTKNIGAPKVRFGYTPFLDAIDNRPVRNLIFYNFPSGTTGVLRYSNGEIYNYVFTGATWGAAVQTLTEDTPLAFATLAGINPYLHISNDVDGYFTTVDGINYIPRTGDFTPKAIALAAFQSRIFADVNKRSLTESAISFDLNGFQLAGTLSATNGSPTVTGSSTKFLTQLIVGNFVTITNTTYLVNAIASDTSLTLGSNFLAGTASGLSGFFGYTEDPFFNNPNDPAGGGRVTLDDGNNGRILSITASVDRINVYKQFGVYRFNGQVFMKFPFQGSIFANTVVTSKNDIDYFLSGNGIWKNTGSAIEPADFGVHNIILDTLRVHGITNPVAFSFDDYTGFFIGTLRVGTGDQAIDIPNGMLVHHERFDEWYIWQLGHTMTSFGYFIDPVTSQPQLLSGDNNGNTYVWGEQFANDAGIPIPYRMRTKYWTFGSPRSSKIPDRWSASTNVGSGAMLQFAIDYRDEYTDQGFLSGALTKGYFDNNEISEFKALSVQIQGSTSTDRPEFDGISVSCKDMEDRRETKAFGTAKK